MTLKSRITDDMKAALRAKDAARLSAIRLLMAAIKQREIDQRKEMADADVPAIIDKMVKQRKDSIAQFVAGNRKDLADAHRVEEQLGIGGEADVGGGKPVPGGEAVVSGLEEGDQHDPGDGHHRREGEQESYPRPPPEGARRRGAGAGTTTADG